jgi:hypothetical protein
VERFGKPVAVTANEPGIPTKKVAVFGLVICGASHTSNVRGCEVDPAAPALSFKVIVYWPPVPGTGVPVMLAVLPEVNESPRGNEVSVLKLTLPWLVSMLNKPSVPTVKEVVLGLVNTGIFSTVTGNGLMTSNAYAARGPIEGLNVSEVPTGGCPSARRCHRHYP